MPSSLHGWWGSTLYPHAGALLTEPSPQSIWKFLREQAQSHRCGYGDVFSRVVNRDREGSRNGSLNWWRPAHLQEFQDRVLKLYDQSNTEWQFIGCEQGQGHVIPWAWGLCRISSPKAKWQLGGQAATPWPHMTIGPAGPAGTEPGQRSQALSVLSLMAEKLQSLQRDRRQDALSVSYYRDLWNFPVWRTKNGLWREDAGVRVRVLPRCSAGAQNTCRMWFWIKLSNARHRAVPAGIP